MPSLVNSSMTRQIVSWNAVGASYDDMLPHDQFVSIIDKTEG